MTLDPALEAVMKSSNTKKIELPTITTSATSEKMNIPLMITRPSSAKTSSCQATKTFQTTSHSKPSTPHHHNSSNKSVKPVRLPELNVPKKIIKGRIYQTESKSTSSTKNIKRHLQQALAEKIKGYYSTSEISKTKKDKKTTVYRAIKDITERPRMKINTLFSAHSSANPNDKTPDEKKYRQKP